MFQRSKKLQYVFYCLCGTSVNQSDAVFVWTSFSEFSPVELRHQLYSIPSLSPQQTEY